MCCGKPRDPYKQPVYVSYRRALDANSVCWLCDLPLGEDAREWTVDHKQPLSKGGTNAVTNLAPAHLRCNSSRGAR